jgi:multisubunit Na+/H+ antiporter MnhB subunit
VNVAQFIALAATAVACVVLFVIMRYPQLRRPQFQGGRSFSIGVSFACALAVFAVFAWLILRLKS